MRRFCKVLAIILSILMLTTMATACKTNTDDANLGALSGNSGISGSNGDNNAGGGDDLGEDNSGSANNAGDATGGNSSGGSSSNKNDKNNSSGKDNSSKPSDKNETPDKGSDNTGNQDVIKDYDETKKYNADTNPLVAEKKEPNGGVAPSFNLDTTGFVKNNIKLKDLKGKSLTFLTAIMYDTFQYVDTSGKLQGEWEWFKMLQKEYGLKINYIKTRFDKSMGQALTYMTSGKQIDIIPTHVGAFPTCLQLTQPLDPYVNMNNLGNSPGVDLQVLEETKWAGKYRCIAPIGAVNVLWYNQSLCEELGLLDPHTLWQQGKWNWNTWRSWIQSIPPTNNAGKPLASYYACVPDIWYAFALTNGFNPVAIDTASSEPNLINNFRRQEVLDAWEYCVDTLASAKNLNMKGASWDTMFSEGNVMMYDTLNLMNEFAYEDYYKYCHDKQYNWVPYPKSGTKTGRDVAFCYGYTMMLPKKMKVQSNAIYAVKFMELWANRFTEAIFDYQATINYLSFDYTARKEYFTFVTQNTYFGLQMDEWRQLSGNDKSAMGAWQYSFVSRTANIVTESKKVANLVDKAIASILDYGL